jgi:hypothetical protein
VERTPQARSGCSRGDAAAGEPPAGLVAAFEELDRAESAVFELVVVIPATELVLELLERHFVQAADALQDLLREFPIRPWPPRD